MGFDIIGPTRHVRASTLDDGGESPYDIFLLPDTLGVHCPQLANLNRRFYESTAVSFHSGNVHRLRDELQRLQAAYSARRVEELLEQRHVRARDLSVRSAIAETLLKQDTVYCVLDEFVQLCEEAMAAQADVRCAGD